MGSNTSREHDTIPKIDGSYAFVQFVNFRKNWSSDFIGSNYCSFGLMIKYQRYRWMIHSRFSDIVSLDELLVKLYPSIMQNIKRPKKFGWRSVTDVMLSKRGEDIANYLQNILNIQEIFLCLEIQEFLGISQQSFNPELGRKGKEGYLRKKSGGYVANHSSKNPLFRTWSNRWVVICDNYIAYYAKLKGTMELKGMIQIDQALDVYLTSRHINIRTRTRTLTLKARTTREAREWTDEITRFYVDSQRRLKQPFLSSFPPRLHTDVKLYLCGKEYFTAAAIALLSARREILIASWMVTPDLLMTRSPYPPVRLDQILKLKADQGVRICVILYKEVEMAGTGNESMKCKLHLEKLSPNIYCMRHPNKIGGSSTALLWSHHEKLIIVDRNVAFVGGIDPCIGRWDTAQHPLTDVDGVNFPGDDYYQPGSGLFVPVKYDDSSNAQLHAPVVEVEEEEAVDAYDVEERSNTTVGERPEHAGRLSEELDQESVASVDAGGVGDPEDGVMETSVFDEKAMCSDLGVSAEQHVVESAVDESKDEDVVPYMNYEDMPADIRTFENTNSMKDIFTDTVNMLTDFTSNIDVVGSLTETINTHFESLKEMQNSSAKTPVQRPMREVMPRMPWHDIHACVSSMAAKDLAAHFVQRWNHHRLSKSELSRPILMDGTDNPFFSMCARCDTVGIIDHAVVCPKCGLSLGRGKENLNFKAKTEEEIKEDNSFFPVNPLNKVSSFCYISYCCAFKHKMHCTIKGTGPTVVSDVEYGFNGTHTLFEDGRVLEKSGNDELVTLLIDMGMHPVVGDVILMVDSFHVSHLGQDAIQRLLQKQFFVKNKHSVKVLFRRYYVADAVDVLNWEEKLTAAEKELKNFNSKMKPTTATASAKAIEDQSDSSEVPSPNAPPKSQVLSSDGAPSSPGPELLSPPKTGHGTDLIIRTRAGSTGVIRENRNSVTVATNNIHPLEKKVKEAQHQLYATICKTTENYEVLHTISSLQAQANKGFFADVLPNPLSCSGSCLVQVIRSVGPWSVGHEVENSIQNAWVDAIKNAVHFIYIENQFFLGDLGSTEILNSIARTILDRVTSAVFRNEPFKVIIVIPMHPEGDFVHSDGPRNVLHYQYSTICRSKTALLTTLAQRFPGRDLTPYICFTSLRTWGVINDTLVFDQIYVHDKLLIVDDRVLIVGSANINDRSMLGVRDTEVCIRLEDSHHVQTKMNGSPFVVGSLPHNFRMRLMRTHVGDMNFDFSDPLCAESTFKWIGTALKNGRCYDFLEKQFSVDRVKDFSQFESANRDKRSWNIKTDMEAKQLVEMIQGHLVMWPLNYLEKENLAPSFASQVVVPTALWV